MNIYTSKENAPPKLPGIYKLTVGKFDYYGRSKNIRNRFLEHLRNLKKGGHSNIRLQRAFNKYKSINCLIVLVVGDVEDQKLYEGWLINNTTNVNVASSKFGGGPGKLKDLPMKIAEARRQVFKINNQRSWDNPSDQKLKEVENRKSFDYKLFHSKNNFVVHTPFGIFPSFSDARRSLHISDFYSLKSWLSGKRVTHNMVGSCKNVKHFSSTDIGKNTNDLGWYYLPLGSPSIAE